MSQHHGLKKIDYSHHLCSKNQDQNQRSDRFGRMFPDLPSLYTDPQVLKAIGSPGGPMDGGVNSNATKTVDVGQVFFGQFIDHDITLDTTSSLSAVNNPGHIQNMRTPVLDLDCIYGGGPEASPYLYHQKEDEFKEVKLLTGEDVDAKKTLIKNDLIRTPHPHNRAIIGDFRNDENRIISQMQLAMIRFHNNVVHKLSAENQYSRGDLFEAAREMVTRHYHWAVLYDFLPAMCGSAVVWDILKTGRQYYCPDEAYIPVEFSVAAYRFGHSMAPQKIRVQKGGPKQPLFDEPLGRGFTRLASEEAIVDFHELFQTSEKHSVQKAEKLDTKLAKILLDLPFITTPGDETSLATRNMLRGQSYLLPAGEVLATKLALDAKKTDKVSECVIHEEQIRKVSKFADHAAKGQLGGKTPLWFYLLAEAECIGKENKLGHFEAGEGLGPLGARLVAEVIIGLMELDPHSYMATNRSWHPGEGLGDHVKTVGDILTYNPNYLGTSSKKKAAATA